MSAFGNIFVENRQAGKLEPHIAKDFHPDEIEVLGDPSPIAEMPPELLIQVFLICAMFDPNSRYSSGRTVRYASQVCRYWREVAFASPLLWCNIIDFANTPKRWIEELLSRSGEYPIDIISHLNYRSKPERTYFALKYLSRARTVNISGLPNVGPLRPLLEQPAPSLESFTLSVNADASGSFSGMGTFPAGLSKYTFSSDAPNLRQLHLTNYTIVPTAPILRNITHFSLRSISLRYASSLSECALIIGAMPLLQHLEFAKARYVEDEEDIPDDVGINLPYLSNLSLESVLPVCSYLLRCLIIPPTCSLLVSCSKTRAGSEYRHIYSTFVKKLSHWPSIAGHYMLVYVSSYSISYRNYYRDVTECDGFPAFRLQLSWVMDDYGEEIEFPHVSPPISSFLTDTCLSLAETLIFDGGEYSLDDESISDMTSILKDIMHGLNKVMTLEVHMSPIADTILPILVEETMRNKDQLIPFPSLHTLVPRYTTLDAFWEFIDLRSSIGSGIVVFDTSYCSYKDYVDKEEHLHRMGVALKGVKGESEDSEWGNNDG